MSTYNFKINNFFKIKFDFCNLLLQKNFHDFFYSKIYVVLYFIIVYLFVDYQLPHPCLLRFFCLQF